MKIFRKVIVNMNHSESFFSEDGTFHGLFFIKHVYQ